MQKTRLHYQWRKFIGLTLFNVAISNAIAGDPGSNLEYIVKAGFLGNFAKFTQWPNAYTPRPNSAYVIGIVGMDPFGKVIDRAIDGFTISGKSVVIKRFKDAKSLEFCHILFISRSQSSHLEDIFLILLGVPTLTVSEMEGFCQKGGMINFVSVEDNIRFEINPDAAEKARLKLSSNLLSLAKAIHKN